MTGQSNAAAQGTAIALGSYHTVALLCQPGCSAPEYAMFSMGRGFHGQLGLERFDNQEAPQRVRAHVLQLWQRWPDTTGMHARMCRFGGHAHDLCRCLKLRTTQMKIVCGACCVCAPTSMCVHWWPSMQVGAVERDVRVPLYQGTPEDIHLAVVSAGSSHSASISRRQVV